MCKILDQYTNKIKGAFSFFDRMIINGYFRPFLSEQMRGDALYQLGVLYKDFKSYFMDVTNTLTTHIENSATERRATGNPGGFLLTVCQMLAVDLQLNAVIRGLETINQIVSAVFS